MGPAAAPVVCLALLPRELPVQPWTPVSCPPTKARCMSSLDLDRPSAESSRRRSGAGTALAPDGGTRPRRTPRPAPGRAPTVVPAPRPGEARPARRPRPTPRPAAAAAAAAAAAEPATGGVDTADLVFLGTPVSLVKRVSL